VNAAAFAAHVGRAPASANVEASTAPAPTGRVPVAASGISRTASIAAAAPALAGFSRSLYVPDKLGSMCPGLGLAPLPTRSGRAALLIGHGRGNRRCGRSPARAFFRLRSAPGISHRRSVRKLARVFVKLLSAHAPMMGRVTATAAASSSVPLSRASEQAAPSVTSRGALWPMASSSLSLLESSMSPEAAATAAAAAVGPPPNPPISIVTRVAGSGNLQASAVGSAGVLEVLTLQVSGRWAARKRRKAAQPRARSSGPPFGTAGVFFPNSDYYTNFEPAPSVLNGQAPPRHGYSDRRRWSQPRGHLEARKGRRRGT